MTTTFTFEEIENDPQMQKFLKKKMKRSESTKKGYIYVLKSFSNFTGKSPKQIHDIHKQELRDKIPEFDQWLNEMLEDYVSHLIEEDFKYGGIKWNISKIKSYLHAFKLRPTPEVEIPIKHVKEDAKYSLKVEDIRKAIRNSIPKYQTLFITQAQTGLSVSDALLLDVEDFVFAVSKKGETLSIKEAINRVKTEDNIIGCFDLRRKKSSQEFYTFIGPEALRNIATLLEAREEKYLKLDSPIFIKDNSKTGYKNTILDSRLKRQAVMKYLNRMHVDRKVFPRINVGGEEKNYFRTHKLRKWFSNQLRFEAGFNSDDVKYLMGQKTGDVIEYYLDTNNYKSLKNNYRKALPYLAIADTIVLREDEEAMEQMEERLKKSENINKELSERLDQAEWQNKEFKKQIPELIELVDLFKKDPELMAKAKEVAAREIKK